MADGPGLIRREDMVPGFSDSSISRVEAPVRQVLEPDARQEDVDKLQQTVRDNAMNDYAKIRQLVDFSKPVYEVPVGLFDPEPEPPTRQPVVLFDDDEDEMGHAGGNKKQRKKKKKEKEKKKKKAKKRRESDGGADDDGASSGGSSCLFPFTHRAEPEARMSMSISDAEDEEGARKRKADEELDEAGQAKKKQRTSLALDVSVTLRTEPIAAFEDTYRHATLNDRQGRTKDRVDLILRANCLGIFVACDPQMIEDRERALNIAIHRNTYVRTNVDNGDDDDQDYKQGYIYDPTSTHQVNIV